MSVREFEMELEVVKMVHFDKDADESYGFGIYSCKPVGYTRELTYSKYGYGNISLQGTTRKLVEGEKYEIKFEGVYNHTKHGSFYKLVSVTPVKLDSIEDQDRFLLSIITPPQFKSLKEAYPNVLLVDLILEKKVDTKKTRGIKEKSLVTITAKVEKNMHISILLSKLNELELSTNMLDKLMGHFGEVDVILDVIEKNIYQLCDIRGLGYKTIDGVALRRGDEPTNKNRITACFNHLLGVDNQNGHTWSVRDRLIDDATELLYIDQVLTVDRLNELSRNGDLYCGDGRVANTRIRNQEKEIYRHLKRIRDSYVTVDGVEEKIVRKVEKMESEQGFLFTEEQRRAIILGAKDGVMILNGLAGSGKSHSVKALIDSLGSNNYVSCALSGKAVKVLSQRQIEAATIHRMLGFQRGEFLHNEHNPLPYDLIVVDEMSMVDTKLFLSILKAVPNQAKLILVGDIGQLPAIGYGDVLRDLLTTKVFPTYELTEVHRQAKSSGVLSLANSVRFGNQIMPYNTSGRETYGELKDQTVISYKDKNSIPMDIIKIANSYKSKIEVPEDLYDFQVIVANRENGALSTKNMNIELQKVFNDMSKPFLNRGFYSFRQGDKVISQGNAYEQSVFASLSEYNSYNNSAKDTGEEEDTSIGNKEDIFNGTMGYIHTLLLEEKAVLVQYEGVDGLIYIEQSDLDKLDMSYAATCHRLQGSAVKNIVIGLDYGAYMLLTKQWLYTALTRSSHRGILLAENNAMFTAIENDASSRRTFLADIMREDSDAPTLN